jgi:GNAT superfamily N-acetyltransferase
MTADAGAALRIETGAAAQDVACIHRFLSEESAWARGIPVDTVRKAIAHSLNFGGFVGSEQVAYARVVTDHATFAYLVDVFVRAEHRGRGHAKALLDAVFADPRLQGLRRFLLATSTAHGLYARYGFTTPTRPQTLMERYVPDPYGPAVPR